jgi:hypothetical protein
MRRKLIFVLVAVAVAAVAATAWAAVLRPEPPPASVFVAPRGDDDRSCRSWATACATFARAYEVARPGEVVEVAGGRYPSQQLVADDDKDSPQHVVFRPAAGAKVTLDGLTLGSSADAADGPRHVTIERMRTSYRSRTEQRSVVALPGTADVVWREIDAGNFILWGVQGFVVDGGDWGPCAIGPDARCGNSRIDSGPAGQPTRDVTIDGARFHDYRFDESCFEPGQDCHFECMYVNAAANVTVRRSTFRDCALYDLFVTISGPDAARAGHRGLTIENNWFDAPWDESSATGTRRGKASALALNWCQNSPHGYRDVLIRFNSFQRNTGFLMDPNPDCVFENVRVVGNVLAWDGCDPRWTYAYNVWTTEVRRGSCSPTDRITGGAPPYERPAGGPGFDFHLDRERAQAVEDLVPAGVPGGCPPVDVDRDPRPARGRCDAGADELSR